MRASRTYFAVPYQLDGNERYFIWYSDEVDGVILAAPGRIASFPAAFNVIQFLAERSLALEPEISDVYNFDDLAAWVANPKVETLDCEAMLSMWNMFADVARSLSIAVLGGKDALNVYDKLFCGSNLPAVTPAGKTFEPDWSEDELATLAYVLDAGLANLRAAIALTG